MGTKTLGTNAQTTLTAISFNANADVADMATIAELILNDMTQPQGQLALTAPSAKPIWPGAFARTGILYVPNRGILRAQPGDWVGIDANGWPILVSANAIAGGSSPSVATSWTHT